MATLVQACAASRWMSRHWKSVGINCANVAAVPKWGSTQAPSRASLARFRRLSSDHPAVSGASSLIRIDVDRKDAPAPGRPGRGAKGECALAMPGPTTSRWPSMVGRHVRQHRQRQRVVARGLVGAVGPVLVDLGEERGDEACAVDDGLCAGHIEQMWQGAMPAPGGRSLRQTGLQAASALAQNGSATTPGVAPPTAKRGWNSSFGAGVVDSVTNTNQSLGTTFRCPATCSPAAGRRA